MPRSYIVTTSTALNTLNRRSEGGFCEQGHHHRADFRRFRWGDVVPVTYYTLSEGSYPDRVRTVKAAVLCAVGANRILALPYIEYYVKRLLADFRSVPRHTIRARISELVASGDLIRLIDARYAHDEAMRQECRAMQRLKKAWREQSMPMTAEQTTIATQARRQR